MKFTLTIRFPSDGFSWKIDEMERITSAIVNSNTFPPDFKRVAAVVGTRSPLECKCYIIRAVNEGLISFPKDLELIEKPKRLEGELEPVKGLGTLSIWPSWAIRKNFEDLIKFRGLFLKLAVGEGIKKFISKGVQECLSAAWMAVFVAVFVWFKMNSKKN